MPFGGSGDCSDEEPAGSAATPVAAIGTAIGVAVPGVGVPAGALDVETAGVAIGGGAVAGIGAVAGT